MKLRTIIAIVVAVIGVGPAFALGLLFGFDKKVSNGGDQGTAQILGLIGSTVASFIFGLGAAALLRNGAQDE